MADDLNLAMRLYLEANGFSSGLNQSGRDVSRWGRGVQQVIRQNRKDFDAMVGHFTRGLAGLATAKIGFDKALKPGIKAAGDLQESLLSVKQILQGAHPQAKLLADQMDRISQNSIQVASHMKFGAAEITDVTRQLLQGGVPLKAILGRHAAAFAVEALAETQHTVPSTTALNLANVGHAFQLTPDQYAPAADLIAKASVTGSGTLTELFHNLEQVGSNAHMAGNTDLKATLAALKAVSPLGEQGGSDLKAVIMSMEGARLRGSSYMHRLGLSFYDKKGNFIGLDASITRLREAMAKLPTQQARLEAMGRIFQTGGSSAANLLIAPASKGVKSYQEIKASIDQQASLVQQMKVWEEGFNASLQMLSSTNKTTLATLFDPLIAQLTKAVKLTNELSGAIGNTAHKHPALAGAVSYGGAGVIAGAAGFGIYHLLKAIGPGKRFLGAAAKNLFGTAAGVAEGKVLQSAAGVTPVFVVNFPGQAGFAGLPRGIVPAGEEAVAGGVIASKAGKLARLGTLGRVLAGFGGADVTALLGSGAFGIGAVGAGVLGAGAGGYAAGSEIYKLIAGGKFADAIGSAIAHALAPFDATARGAIQRSSGKLDININPDGKPRVTRLVSHDPTFDLNVSVGGIHAGAHP